MRDDDGWTVVRRGGRRRRRQEVLETADWERFDAGRQRTIQYGVGGVRRDQQRRNLPRTYAEVLRGERPGRYRGYGEPHRIPRSPSPNWTRGNHREIRPSSPPRRFYRSGPPQARQVSGTNPRWRFGGTTQPVRRGFFQGSTRGAGTDLRGQRQQRTGGSNHPTHRVVSDDPDFNIKIRIIHRVITVAHHLTNITAEETPPAIGRMTETLASFIKPAASTATTDLLLQGNARNWEHTVMVILKNHYTEVMEEEITKLEAFSNPNWRGPFAIASTWAKRNLGRRLKAETLAHVEAIIVAQLQDTTPHTHGTETQTRTHTHTHTHTQTDSSSPPPPPPPLTPRVSPSSPVPAPKTRVSVATMTDRLENDWSLSTSPETHSPQPPCPFPPAETESGVQHPPPSDASSPPVVRGTVQSQLTGPKMQRQIRVGAKERFLTPPPAPSAHIPLSPEIIRQPPPTVPLNPCVQLMDDEILSTLAEISEERSASRSPSSTPGLPPQLLNTSLRPVVKELRSSSRSLQSVGDRIRSADSPAQPTSDFSPLVVDRTSPTTSPNQRPADTPQRGDDSFRSLEVLPLPDLTSPSPPAVRVTRRPTRHPTTTRKFKEWGLRIRGEVLIVGDSNLARCPAFKERNLQVDSYPGANFSHAAAIMAKATYQLPPHTIVLAFGLNHRAQKAQSTALKQLQTALRTAKLHFPRARIVVPLINFSSTLPHQERRNLNYLNKYIFENCDSIPQLPLSQFRTERDCIHWSRGTAAAMLSHWCERLGLNELSP